jgi:chemotaxis protein histidine kinase CheA
MDQSKTAGPSAMPFTVSPGIAADCSAPDLDRSAFEILVEELGRPDALQTFSVFFIEVENRLKRLQELAGAKDGDAIKHEAHALKGSAGNFGFLKVADLANTKKGRITLSASMREGVLVIAVKDTGPGMAPNMIGRLFETFGYSEEETASKYADDVRLGLPLAHRYCQLMGGELSVRSRLGHGSCFIMRLPIQRADAEAWSDPTMLSVIAAA